jgi:hypothetical protein
MRMGLVDLLINSGNGDLLKQVAGKVGNEGAAKDLLSTLGSAMLGQVKGRVESDKIDSTGLEGLIKNSKYADMLDNPNTHLNSPKAEEEGIDILSYITGSKEGSREVASQVSEKTGVSSSLIKSLLPMIAPMIIGSLTKGMSSGFSNNTSKPANNDSGILSSLLDFDKDGSVLDDVAGLAWKFLR